MNFSLYPFVLRLFSRFASLSLPFYLFLLRFFTVSSSFPRRFFIVSLLFLLHFVVVSFTVSSFRRHFFQRFIVISSSFLRRFLRHCFLTNKRWYFFGISPSFLRSSIIFFPSHQRLFVPARHAKIFPNKNNVNAT